jgi:Tfp pilus assembly protein PilO
VTRALVILLALILPPLLYFPTVAPRRNAVTAKAEAELYELEERVEMARRAQGKLAQFREEAATLDRELTKLRRILPPEMAIEDLRGLATTIASEQGVSLERFEPRAVEDASPLQRLSIEIAVVGSAASIAAFLEKLENTSRILDVSDVALRRDPAGWRAQFLSTTHAMR